MVKKQKHIGDKVDIVMKPVTLRAWKVVGVTKKCLVIDKRRGGKYPRTGKVYVPLSQIACIEVASEQRRH